MTLVVNKRRESFDVSIGRDSWFGNPYRIGPDGTRADVIRKHKEWLDEWIENKREIRIGKYSNKWVVEHLSELRDQRVGCFCKPLACHGDYLVELVGRLLIGRMRGWGAGRQKPKTKRRNRKWQTQ